MTLASRFAQCFPVIVGDFRVELVGVEEAEDRVAITAQVITMQDGAMVDLREQSFPLERGAPGSRPDRRALAPREIDVEALAANVRHHLARVSFPMPMELFEPPAPYRRVGPFARTQLGIEDAGTALMEQAWEHGFEMRYWVVDQWPEEARTVFYLHCLCSMAGGNGLEVFLHQNDPAEVVAVLGALRRAACERLARRYCQALDLAAQEQAEPVLCVDERWLDENRLALASEEAPQRWRAIDSHDEGGTYWLIDHELRPAAAAFLREHRATLFLPG